MVEKKLNILFTGGGGSGTEGLYELMKNKYNLYFADSDELSRPYFLSNDKWFTIPNANCKNFSKEIIGLCLSYKIDIIVPGVDEELLKVNNLKSRMKTNIFLPESKFLKIHLDKLSSSNFLYKNNIDIPKFCTLDKLNIKYPFILKPRSGRGSKNVSLIKDHNDLKASIQLSRLKEDQFIVQEYIKGQKYTITVIANKKKIIRAVVPVKIEKKKGITIRGVISKENKIIEFCSKVHKTFPVCGSYNIQLIKDENGNFKIFEINPRISTTMCLVYASGVNFIRIFSEDNFVCSNNPDDMIKFKDGVRLQRSWKNHFWGI
jgi:carbamoyl-phosphate synthase large subunit